MDTLTVQNALEEQHKHSKESIRKELPLRLREWFQSQRQWKTRAELAKYLQINPKTFDDYFNGRNLPGGEKLTALAKLTNLPILLELQSLKSKNSNNVAHLADKQIKTTFNGNLALEKAHEVHAEIIKLNGLLDLFKKGTAEERVILKKTIPPQQIGYITSLLKAMYNEDEFQQWIFFSNYSL